MWQMQCRTTHSNPTLTSKEHEFTYRIPPQGRPGLLPNRQGLGIVLANGQRFGDGKEGVDDGTWIGGVEREDVGLVGQKGFRELRHRLRDGGAARC